MAKWVHADVLDGELNVIKTNANVMHLIKAYSAGDSYATVTGNSVANYSMVSGDYTLGNGASSSRTLTTGAKSGNTATANSGATPNLHIAFVDSTNSKVLAVTDETSDQEIVSGNGVNIPAITFTATQPT